ncbi:hypothetical protein H131_05963 [Lysinibacillus sphaericus OT4b.31]|uniref:Uncharacterized protein n=2 Tax=Lysinibacillus TaxID=400634 RepID=R7ZHC4_LYSSH|nr:hypothetical protein H131_05963 [Lysinibacillus sphaericus OT4b.31]
MPAASSCGVMETSDGIKEVYETNYKDAKKIINHTDAHNNTTTFVQDLSGNITASINGERNETKYS